MLHQDHRPRTGKTWSTFLVGCCLALAGILGTATASAQNALQAIKDRGVIRVGIGVDWPPYDGMDASNQPYGYDASVAQLLAEHMGLKLEYVILTGPNRIPFLMTDKADVVIASLAITPERQKQVDFSPPYSYTSMVLVGPAHVNIETPQDFLKYRISVSRASTEEMGVERVAPPGTKLHKFDDSSSGIQAMLVGQVDAVGVSTAIAGDLQKRFPGKYKTVYVINSQVMAIAMLKDRPELLAAMNEFVATNLANGKLSALFEKHLGQPLPEDVTNYRPS